MSVHRIGFASVILSPLFAIAATVFFLTMPAYSSGQTLVEHNGPWAIIPLLVPIVVSVVPLMVRRKALAVPVRSVAAGLLFAFSVITGFSIGLFYLPSTGAMFLAVVFAVIERRMSNSADNKAISSESKETETGA